jgi:flagellar protein FliO/FliZ
MKKIAQQMGRGLVLAIFLTCTAASFAQTQPAIPVTSASSQVQTVQPAQAGQPDQTAAALQPGGGTQVAGNVIPNTAAANKPSTASQLASLLGGLLFILALIFGLSWFVKRFSQGGFMQNPAMKVVAAMPLGTRERLMLVAVGDKQILLGVTATQISNLHVFDYPVVTAGDKEAGSDFSQKLMAILQQKNISQSGNSSPRDRQA